MRITTMRVRPARREKFEEHDIAPAQGCVEVTVWGETVAIVHIGEKVDDVLYRLPALSEGEIIKVISGYRALILQAEKAGVMS